MFYVVLEIFSAMFFDLKVFFISIFKKDKPITVFSKATFNTYHYSKGKLIKTETKISHHLLSYEVFTKTFSAFSNSHKPLKVIVLTKYSIEKILLIKYIRGTSLSNEFKIVNQVNKSDDNYLLIELRRNR